MSTEEPMLVLVLARRDAIIVEGKALREKFVSYGWTPKQIDRNLQMKALRMRFHLIEDLLQSWKQVTMFPPARLEETPK
jgi:hypothetical protein